MHPLAFGLAVSSAVLHAGWNLAAKRASGDFGVLWLGLCVAAALGAPVVAFLPSAGGLGAILPWLAATGLLHAVYFAMLGRSYERGEISVVYPVARGTSVAATAALGLTLGERGLSDVGLVGAGLVIAGLALMAAPGLKHAHGKASLAAAVVSGLALACGLLVDGFASRGCHPFAYDWGLFAATAVALAPLAWRERERCARAAKERLGLACWVGGGALAAYLLVLWAYRYAPVPYVVAARECSVALGALLGVFVLGEPWSAAKVGGLAAIAAGLVLLRLA